MVVCTYRDDKNAKKKRANQARLVDGYSLDARSLPAKKDNQD